MASFAGFCGLCGGGLLGTSTSVPGQGGLIGTWTVQPCSSLGVGVGVPHTRAGFIPVPGAVGDTQKLTQAEADGPAKQAHSPGARLHTRGVAGPEPAPSVGTAPPGEEGRPKGWAVWQAARASPSTSTCPSCPQGGSSSEGGEHHRAGGPWSGLDPDCHWALSVWAVARPVPSSTSPGS